MEQLERAARNAPAASGSTALPRPSSRADLTRGVSELANLQTQLDIFKGELNKQVLRSNALEKESAAERTRLQQQMEQLQVLCCSALFE